MFIVSNEDVKSRSIESILSKLHQAKINSSEMYHSTLFESFSHLFTTEAGERIEFAGQIVNTGDNDDYIGVKVYPKLELLLTLVKKMTYDKISLSEFIGEWKNLNSFFIEIDSKLFDGDILINANEIFALMVYEIERVLSPLFGGIAESVYTLFREVNDDIPVRDLSTLKVLSALYIIPVIGACNMNSIYDAKQQIISNGGIIKQLGLENDLVEAVDKLFYKYSSFNTLQHDIDHVIKTDLIWCSKMVSNQIVCNKHLKDELYYKATRQTSFYMKVVYNHLLETFRIKMRERYTGIVTECTSIDIYDRTITEKYVPIMEQSMISHLQLLSNLTSSNHVAEANEGLFNFGRNKGLPSQLDIDRVYIEIDKITNHHDRIYVLDLIYECIDAIEAFKRGKEYVRNMSKFDPQIESMSGDLNRLRKACLDKKVGKKYKFFVEYPEGYEG